MSWGVWGSAASLARSGLDAGATTTADGVPLDFVEGKGTEKGLWGMLTGFLGEESELVFTPIEIAEEQRKPLARSFATSASIFTIEAVGLVGRSQIRIESVVNFHARWVPPPPNSGRMPGLGVFHYYRMN